VRLLVLVLGLFAALVLANSAHAAPGALYGVQDDAWLAHGPGTLESRLDELDRLGVDVVRFTVRWDVIADERPLVPRDPTDPARHPTARDPLRDAALGERPPRA
jgi:hypothetical protein